MKTKTRRYQLRERQRKQKLRTALIWGGIGTKALALVGIKLIADPWPSTDVPVVMTSRGRLQRFEIFESEKAKDFYRADLNRAPEPGAP